MANAVTAAVGIYQRYGTYWYIIVTVVRFIDSYCLLNRLYARIYYMRPGLYTLHRYYYTIYIHYCIHARAPLQCHDTILTDFSRERRVLTVIFMVYTRYTYILLNINIPSILGIFGS